MKNSYIAKNIMQIVHNFWFAYKHRHLKSRRKILYALTPPPYLQNIGDHAQVVAIRAWMKKHFPKMPIIEMQKDEVNYFLPALKWLIQPDDIIFLHSGGNLGDRGIWSEGRRRLLISTFTKNKIVSLPQTIYFSDTPMGRKEKENTRRIYAMHPNLTVIARDLHSGELAEELFPNAKTFCIPDFVLSLPLRKTEKTHDPIKVLLCLRNDSESVLTEDQKKKMDQILPYECIYYDTTQAEPIEINKREAVLEQALDLFCAAELVITDRFHGVIFAVVCQKPCVVLRTIDHKLTSGLDWFKDVPFVMLARNVEEIPLLAEKCLAVKTRGVPDWNAKYFDKLPERIEMR